MPSLSGRGFGWIESPDDPSALAFSAHPAATNPVVPPRTFLTVPRSLDQGALGSCTWNATAMAIAILALSRGIVVWLSRLMGYREARILMGPQFVNQDSGAQPDDALLVAQRGLVGPESLWPYDIAKFKQKPPPEAYAAATAHSLKSYKIPQAGCVLAAKQALAARFPVNMGFRLRANAQGVMQIDRLVAGVYPWTTAEPFANPPEGHDVLLVGYDNDKQAFLACNSWDDDWGVEIPGQPDRGRGAFWIPFAMFASSDVSNRSAVTDWQ